MNEVEFTIPGQPVAKGRPKFSTRGKFPRAYTPEKTVTYESTVRLFAAQAMQGRPPMTAPVSLNIRIALQIPTSWSKKRQQLARDTMIGATKKPDADNVAKAICDAINGVVFVDDAQIVSLCVVKEYSDAPGVSVIANALPIQAA